MGDGKSSTNERSARPAAQADRVKWSWPDLIAAAGVLVALFAVFDQRWAAREQLAASREQSAEQHKQVLAQLAQQQQFSQVLQAQQHELSLRQLEVQDRLSRQQFEFQKGLEEAWEQRRLADAKREACRADEAQIAQVRSALYQQLLDETPKLLVAIYRAQMYSMADSYIRAALGSQDSSSRFLNLPEDWDIAKDLATVMLDAGNIILDRELAFSRMDALSVSIARSFPVELVPAIDGLRAAFPRRQEQLEGFQNFWDLLQQESEKKTEAFSDTFSAEIRAASELMRDEYMADISKFLRAQEELRLRMLGVVVAKGTRCQ